MNFRVLVISLVFLSSVPAAGWAQSTGGHSAGEPQASRADPDKPKGTKKYPWRYHRFDTTDVAVTTLTGAGFMIVHFGVDPARESKWSSSVLLDNEARDFFVADSRTGRDRADRISDVFWYTPLALPWLDLAFPLLVDDWNFDTAWQMTAINFEAFAVSGFITRAGHRFVARARPDVEPCLEDPEYSSLCFSGSYASFPSGHTSTATVGAGLMCAHHLSLGLIGSDVADGLVCGLSASMAVGSGMMRMIADRHYVGDVIAGAAIGFGSGFALPLLRHYQEEEPDTVDASKVRWTMMPSVQGKDGLGMAAFGWF